MNAADTALPRRDTRIWSLLAAALALLPLLLQLPGMLALTIGTLAVLVTAWSQRRTLPGPIKLLLIAGMFFAIYWQMGAGLGRDSGCALLAAMLAIKPAELRSFRDARSLVGFALFAPFAAFLLDQGPASWALSLTAVVAALLALQRISDDQAGVAAPPLRQQLRAVGRLLVLALPLAMAGFWLLPRLPTPLWGTPERSLSRPGLSDTMEPGGWGELMADDSPALRVQFFGPVPAPDQRYWRGPVLTRFDGRSWSRIGNRRQSAPADFTAGPQRWDYQIEYEATDHRDLVALDLPLAAPPAAHLDSDYSLSSERPLNALSIWRLQSAAPRQFQSQLSPTQRQQALQLPKGFNPRTLQLAQQWRTQAGNDDAAIVQRSLEWIHREFAYTLVTPLPGRHSVDEFLFDQKAGYCEHFSGAFAVLMRAAGIPARVVTGYAGGVRNPYGDYWVVRRMDAHAWAEAWLPGRGWVRVDPTAAVAPERIYDTLEDRLGTNTGNAGLDLAGRWTGLLQYGDYLRRGWNNAVLSFDAQRQSQLLRAFGVAKLSPSQLVALFATFAIATVGLMAWLLARGERQRDPLLRAWHRVGQRYARLGLAREPAETALNWAHRVELQLPDCGLSALSQRFSDARYAGGLTDDDSLLADLRRHRPKPGARP
ncbi:MAG: transglutaminaseTgpA domain-containing protein [Stenotrophomonas sp.]